MNLPERIRKVRELRGYKQTTIADMMNITQQAYSQIESGTRPRLKTVLDFCAVVKIEPVFLLSDIPVTDETMERYGNKKYSEVLSVKTGGQYEYRTFMSESIYCGSMPEQKMLEKQDADGWELTGVAVRGLASEKLIYYFKRKK